jgi:retron-type reverse transcriptase
MGLDLQSKFVPIHEQANHNIMHLNGLRLERSTADAIDQCHRVLSLKRSAQWILEGDIRSCFDSGRPFGRLMTGL